MQNIPILLNALNNNNGLFLETLGLWNENNIKGEYEI